MYITARWNLLLVSEAADSWMHVSVSWSKYNLPVIINGCLRIPSSLIYLSLIRGCKNKRDEVSKRWLYRVKNYKRVLLNICRFLCNSEVWLSFLSRLFLTEESVHYKCIYITIEHMLQNMCKFGTYEDI